MFLMNSLLAFGHRVSQLNGLTYGLLIVQAGAREPQGSTFLGSPSAGIASMLPHTQLFAWVLTFVLQVLYKLSHLCGAPDLTFGVRCSR